MTIPIDLPGGEYLPELNSPSMQAGVEKLGPSQYRGVVLIDGGQQPNHVCSAMRATKTAAIGDAEEFISLQGQSNKGELPKQHHD